MGFCGGGEGNPGPRLSTEPLAGGCPADGVERVWGVSRARQTGRELHQAPRGRMSSAAGSELLGNTARSQASTSPILAPRFTAVGLFVASANRK